MPRKKKTTEEKADVKNEAAAPEEKTEAKKPAKKRGRPRKKAEDAKTSDSAKSAPPKKAASKKSTAKKTEAKKPATTDKKTAEKKPAAKKSTSKKSATKKSTAKKTEAKKPATKKSTINVDEDVKEIDKKLKETAKEPGAKAAAPEPTVRYSDEDLEMFKEIIGHSRKEAIEELTMLKERLDDLTSYDFAEESMIYSMHMAEQGSEAMEKEKTYAQIQRINEYIKKLDEALERIKEKTYGICRVCGCLIAKERLMAVPITTLSASYKIHQKCPEDGIDRIEPVSNV